MEDGGSDAAPTSKSQAGSAHLQSTFLIAPCKKPFPVFKLPTASNHMLIFFSQLQKMRTPLKLLFHMRKTTLISRDFSIRVIRILMVKDQYCKLLFARDFSFLIVLSFCA